MWVWEGYCSLSWSAGWSRMEVSGKCENHSHCWVSSTISQKGAAPFLWDSWLLWQVLQNFSSVGAILTALSPSKPFVWSGECQQLFDSLKGLLCCTPVLSAPDFTSPFKFKVDVCAVWAASTILWVSSLTSMINTNLSIPPLRRKLLHSFLLYSILKFT